MNENPTDDLGDIFGRIPQALQDLRIQIAMAQQQYRDVQNDSPTLGNLSARWNAMTQESQKNAIVVLAIVAAIVFKVV